MNQWLPTTLKSVSWSGLRFSLNLSSRSSSASLNVCLIDFSAGISIFVTTPVWDVCQKVAGSKASGTTVSTALVSGCSQNAGSPSSDAIACGTGRLPTATSAHCLSSSSGGGSWFGASPADSGSGAFSSASGAVSPASSGTSWSAGSSSPCGGGSGSAGVMNSVSRPAFSLAYSAAICACASARES